MEEIKIYLTTGFIISLLLIMLGSGLFGLKIGVENEREYWEKKIDSCYCPQPYVDKFHYPEYDFSNNSTNTNRIS